MTATGTAPLWWDTRAAASSSPVGAAAEVPLRADVVVVGGGFTGLWTAYYLLKAQPSLEVLVLEAEHVGFGASGRNGGWVSALWPVSPDTLAARSGRDATLAHLAALRDTVDEVGRVDAEEGLGSGFTKGGTLVVARTPAQEERARAEAAHGESWGDGTVWLDAAAARERLGANPVRGATFNPNCARVQPRDLVDGLAEAVRRRGGRVVEGVRVGRAGDGVVVLADTRRGRSSSPPRDGPRGYRGTSGRSSPCTRSWWRPRSSRPRSGPRWASPGARCSPTTATWSSTASAPSTTGSRSAAGVLRTTWARPSARSSTTRSASSRRCAGP